jgi:Mg2+/Co2+ transporter CorB
LLALAFDWFCFLFWVLFQLIFNFVSFPTNGKKRGAKKENMKTEEFNNIVEYKLAQYSSFSNDQVLENLFELVFLVIKEINIRKGSGTNLCRK